MKNTAKIIVKIFIVALVVTLSMFGAVYAGDWFLDAIGMSVARAKDILYLHLNAGCGLMLFLGICGCLYWFFPLCWKEHKRRKQEAEEARRAAEAATTGGTEHERKGKD